MQTLSEMKKLDFKTIYLHDKHYSGNLSLVKYGNYVGTLF